MGVLFLLNFVLVAIPIGTTVGVLVGIDNHRAATGQEPLFKPDEPIGGPGGGPGGGPPKNDNGIKIEYHCDETLGISPPSQGDHYTLNPNPWGWDEGDPGQLCLNVTTWNNQTYPQESSAPEWSVTWQYPPGPQSAPVHAFPNVKVDSGVFPNAIKDIDEIILDFEWTYAVGNTTAETETDKTELEDNNLNANVALDLFLDKDKEKSKDSEKADMEIMVWFAAFGAATQPIGYKSGTGKILDSQTVGGVDFDLYQGENSVGQKVLTWYSEAVSNKFHEDLFKLVERLVEMDETDFPTEDDYIGYMSVGTETYSADEFVTFHVPELAVDVHLKDK